MNTDKIMRDFRVLLRAQSVIAEIKLNHLAARSGLMAVAALIGVFGLAMLDFAVYFELEPKLGRVGAAALVGFGDLVLAAILFAVAQRVKPGRDLDLAQEIQKSAIDSLANDAREIETEIRALTRMVRNPLDSALPSLIVPLASTLIKALRRK
ncbi:MAG: phage holin family protein [Rhizobiales bacterium]|nr:phage holin family protein [Hyphomicrobiales bacterium]